MLHRSLKRRLIRSFVVAFFAAMTFAAHGNQAFGQKISDYVLGSGDRVRVVVFGQDDLSGEFKVDGAGNISLPLIQVVKAAGLTLRQLEQTITNKLKPDFLKNPRVSLEVLNYRPFYIIGQVKNPGSYPYVAGMTVVNAIALAGGYTYRASESKVLITQVKGGKQRPANRSTRVLPGDVIEIPERFF